jgi:hypothetical protein
VPEDQDRLNEVGLGLSEEQIHLARRAGLRVVARLRNYPGLTPEAARYMLKHVRDHQIQTVIFIGDDVLGFRDLIAPVAKAMRGKTPEETLQFGLIEFARQRGELGLAQALDAAVVRVHSITEQEMRDYSAVRAVERFARAARERNIRLCFVRLFLGPQEDKMAANEEYLRLLDRHFRRAFLKPGPARPFESLRTPRRLLLLMGMGLLAALLLALNRLGLVSARPGMILLVVGTGASVALLVVSPDGYRKLAALGAGILFPTWAGAYAFSAVRKGTEGERRDGRGKGGGTKDEGRRTKDNFPDSDSGKSQIANRKSQIASLWAAAGVLWRATLLTLAGAVFVVGLLTDRSFLVKIDQFAGVKLAHLLPFLLLAGLVVGRLLEPGSEGRERWREAWRQYVDLFRQPLFLFHAVLALAALLALAVLLIRSGNEGMEPSSLEMRFRDVLERILFVRPRTKEFLLGHPLFFLGSAMALLGRPRWLLPCLLLGMVGQVSTLNTFCHLHTPLSISLVRTFHALWLGTLGGTVLTLIVRLYRARSDVTDQAPS